MRCLLPSVAADPDLWNDPELRKVSASFHEDPFSMPPIPPDHKVILNLGLVIDSLGASYSGISVGPISWRGNNAHCMK